MKTLLLHLRLASPLILTGVGNGEENSSQSQPYIPGSAIRGALIGLYLKGRQMDLPGDSKASALFFSGQVRYLNAYPEVLGKRTLPVPVSWRRRKEDGEVKGTRVADLALIKDMERNQRLRKPFVLTKSEEPAIVLDPEETLNLHIGSDGRGVVKEDLSTMFQYQALAKGQLLIAPMIFADEMDFKDLKDLLEGAGTLPIGRSRSTEYGQVIIESVEESSDWRECEAGNPDQEITLTLLSDALLRDKFGEPTLDLDVALTRKLKKPVECKSAFVQSRLRGGYNQKWALPLPQHETLGMGSVFIYAHDHFDDNELKRLEEEGVGERRIDGFGRIGVNWPGRDEIVLDIPASSFSDRSQTLSPASSALAYEMAERMLQDQLSYLLRNYVDRIQVQGNISNHQLSRLRAINRNALEKIIRGEFPAGQQVKADKPLEEVSSFLAELKENARNQLEGARVLPEGIRLLAWMKERLHKKDGPACVNLNEQKLRAVAGIKPKIEPELRAAFTLRLIDAVLEKKMIQNRKEASK
ncbi:MAG: hypothetical protein IT316_12230 [Anaerolineales bacterium]|nr:hypothetical protein [Anaerolineales bacterium]